MKIGIKMNYRKNLQNVKIFIVNLKKILIFFNNYVKK